MVVRHGFNQTIYVLVLMSHLEAYGKRLLEALVTSPSSPSTWLNTGLFRLTWNTRIFDEDQRRMAHSSCPGIDLVPTYPGFLSKLDSTSR